MRDWLLNDENCSHKSLMAGIVVGLILAFIFPFPVIMSIGITALAFANTTELLYWWFRWRRSRGLKTSDEEKLSK